MLQGIACTLGLDRGDDPGIVRVSEDLSVALNAKELAAFETVLCRGEMPFWDTLLVAAGGAGFRSMAQIINESTDLLVVVEAGTLGSSSGAAGSIMFSRTGTVLTTDNGLVAVRDGRAPRGSVPNLRMRSQNNAALPAGVTNGESWGVDTPQTVPQSIPFSVLIPPNQSVVIYPGADNVPIRASFVGRALRIINTRELNP